MITHPRVQRRGSGCPRRGRFALGLLILGVLGMQIVVACGSDRSGPGAGDRIAVVAAENFWGSIASELGGNRVSVLSVVSDPNADPHDYESSAATARAFATAQYVILNGAGYDGWAGTLLSSTDSSSRKVLNVADLIGKKEGDNPHFWYDPSYVEAVAEQVTRDLSTIDPADSAYFTQQHTAFESKLAPYRARISAIRRQYAGQKVASTESIFVYMANALGLDLISPPEFMKAISEGNDPPAASVTAFKQQLLSRQVGVLVYNKQTATDVTSNLEQLASEQGIPMVGVTETIQPPDTPFQAWMDGQLDQLQNALNRSMAGR